MASNWENLKEAPGNSTREPRREAPYNPREGDALQTLMEWLYGQMEKSERVSDLTSGGAP